MIGGGHNGLVAAAYLAKAGARTLVLEARHKTGGAADTMAPWPEAPEFKVTTLSYVMSLMPDTILRDLQLERHGYRVHPTGPYFLPFPDGRCIVQYDDSAKNYDEFAKFSKHDADAIEAWDAWIGGLAEVLGPLLMTTPPTVGSKRPADLMDQLRLVWRFRGLDVKTVGDVTRLMTMSIVDILDRFFESDQVKTVMSLNGLIGTWAGPYEPGTGYVMAHHSIGDVGDGNLGAWAVPEGGMGAVAAAIEASARTFGAEIRTNARVARILTTDGAARGVTLEEGEELLAPLVVTAIHPKITFLQQLDPSELPADFVHDIESWQSRSGVVKINCALDRLPVFTSNPELTDQSGGVELAHSVAYLETAFEEARAGRPSTMPFSDGVVPTSLDPQPRAGGQARDLAVHAVGAARVERGAAPRRAGGLRRPRDRGLRRAGAGVRRQRPASPGDRPVRHGARVGADRGQHLPRRALRGAALPHAARARLRRLPDADPRPVSMLERHARGRRRHRHPGVQLCSRDQTRPQTEHAFPIERVDPMTEQHTTFPFYMATWYRKSPYYQRTVEAGCTSWDLYNHMLIPTLYDDDLKEYWHLLNHVTLWDVAVERQVEIAGPDAARFTQLLTPRDLSSTQVGQCKYVLICAPDGGIVNDPILLKLAEDRFWLSLADSDALLYAVGVQAFAGMDVTIREPDVSPLQVQGPRSKDVIRKLFGDDVMNLTYYWCTEAELDGIPVVVSRTGWTGEVGYEIYLRDASRGSDLWDAVMDAGQEFDIRPIAPSDQRRMEAGIFNYGNDMDITNNPYEVTGLERLVELDNDNVVVSRDALERIAAEGVQRKLVGVKIDGPPLPMWLEDFWPVTKDGREVGRLTSASYSPRLDINMGYAWVPIELAQDGTALQIESPVDPMTATVVPLPFLDPKKDVPKG